MKSENKAKKVRAKFGDTNIITTFALQTREV